MYNNRNCLTRNVIRNVYEVLLNLYAFLSVYTFKVINPGVLIKLNFSTQIDYGFLGWISNKLFGVNN